MADDTTFSVDSVNAGTTAVTDLNDAIAEGNKELQKFHKIFDRNMTDTDKGLQKIIKSIGKITKTFGPAVREFDKFTEIAEYAEEGVKSLEKTYSRAFFAGNKQGMVALSVLKQQGDALASASRALKKTSDQISDLSGEYRKKTLAMLQNRMEMDKVQKAQDELNASIKKAGGVISKEQQAALDKNTVLLDAYKKSLFEDAVAVQNLETSVKALTVEFKNQQEATLQANRELISNAEQMRANNREVRKMAGGWTAVGAAFEETMDTKFFDYLKKGSSLFFVGGGFALFNRGLSQTAEHAQAVSRIALSLGDTSQVGFGRYGQSVLEASDTVNRLTEDSIRLGYSFEDLVDASNRVRAGIRMDREGRLSEKAIQNLTREAAYFARIAGMELADSVALIETRIKRYGMTAEQAAGNIKDMRTTITQMTAGNKANTVAMADMVNMIEEASAASQSYVVDTRIMTQALRGAVNQAELLGVAQKQAKDVAVGVGKILSNAPDFIKIPAGFDLVSQLVGPNADALLMELDAGTRQQVVSIQKALRAGKLDYFVGAKALMDLIGQTDAGLEAQSKHLEQTILQGPAAAELIAEQYGIENRATAFMVTKMMQDAVELRKMVGKDKVGFVTAMVKDTALLNEAIEKTKVADKKAAMDLALKEGISIKDAEEKIKALAKEKLPETLEMRGLSPEQAQEYMQIYETGMEKAKTLQKEIDDLRLQGAQENSYKIAQLERQRIEATTKAQTLAVQRMFNPVKEITDAIAKKTGKPWDVTATLNPEALAKANIKSGKDLAKAIGVNYEKTDKNTRQILDAAVTEQGALTSEQLKLLHKSLSDANRKSESAADIFQSNLMSPIRWIVSGLKLIAAKMNAFGPGGLMLTGLLGMAAGIWALKQGQTRNLMKAVGMLDNSQVIYRQVHRALVAAGGGPGGGGGGYLPDDGPTTEDRIKEGQRRDKQIKRDRVRTEAETARRSRRLAKSTGIKRPLGEAIKGLLKEGRYGVSRGTGAVLSGAGKALGAAGRFGGKLIPYAGTALSLGLLAKDVYGASDGSLPKKDKYKAIGGAIGGLAGGIGGAFLGGPMGAVGGSIGGELLGSYIGGLFAGDETPGMRASSLPGAPTTLPPPAPIGAVRPGGYAALGGGMGRPALNADVSMQSLTPDGALTLKVRGFQELSAQMNKSFREATV